MHMHCLILHLNYVLSDLKKNELMMINVSTVFESLKLYWICFGFVEMYTVCDTLKILRGFSVFGMCC